MSQQDVRTREPGPLRLGKAEFAPGRGLVMAIVNRTPDSFYRPGLTWDFVGETLGAGIEERLAGTLAVTSVAAWLGARVFRAHDVRETRQALDMVASIKGDRAPLRLVRALA